MRFLGLPITMHNMGGKFFQPLGSVRGTNKKGSSLSALGKMSTSFGAFLGISLMR